MKLNWLALIVPIRILLALVGLFLLWQVIVFTRPRPRAYTVAEIRAIEQACRDAAGRIGSGAATPGRVGVAHFADDNRDVVTESMRAAFANRPGWTVVAGSPVRQFLGDISKAVANASSLDEIVHAGRRVEMDVVVAGRVLAVDSTNNTAHAALRVYAFDARAGKWLLQDMVTAEWRPNAVHRLSFGIARMAWPLRLLIWLAVAGLLPWATAFSTHWAMERRSNLTSAVLLIGYTGLDMLAGVALAGFAVVGGLAWTCFFAALVVCAAYNFWACETIARQERQ